jgi:holin-like protein
VLTQIVLILSLLVAGDVVLDALQLPVPGPAAGLIFMTLYFVARGGPTPSAAHLFDTIIPVAPLFFVPAAVGVVANLELIASAWLSIICAITLGTAATLIITGFAAQFALRWVGRRRAPS